MCEVRDGKSLIGRREQHTFEPTQRQHECRQKFGGRIEHEKLTVAAILHDHCCMEGAFHNLRNKKKMLKKCLEGPTTKAVLEPEVRSWTTNWLLNSLEPHLNDIATQISKLISV